MLFCHWRWDRGRRLAAGRASAKVPVDRLPEPRQCDGQQRRRDDQQTCSFHRVDMVSGMPRVGVRLVLHGGGHGPIVAPDASEARPLVSAGGTGQVLGLRSWVLGLGSGVGVPSLRSRVSGVRCRVSALSPQALPDRSPELLQPKRSHPRPKT